MQLLDVKDKSVKETSTARPENLKVYIRVRPKLKSEELKEVAISIDPNVN